MSENNYVLPTGLVGNLTTCSRQSVFRGPGLVERATNIVSNAMKYNRDVTVLTTVDIVVGNFLFST